MSSSDLRTEVDKLLSEGYRLWNDSALPQLPVSERYIASDEVAAVYNGAHYAELAAACQCFYLFRKLHCMLQNYPTWATLLGDYFFSQFSKNLIPIDSVALTDSFSRYLSADTQSSFNTQEYLSFIRSLPMVLKR